MAADFIQRICVYISGFSAQAVRLILINYDFECTWAMRFPITFILKVLLFLLSFSQKLIRKTEHVHSFCTSLDYFVKAAKRAANHHKSDEEFMVRNRII